jgi:hypothetical protein
MKDVNFGVLNFEQYLEMEKTLSNYKNLQNNKETYNSSRDKEIEELNSELSEYQENFKLFFDVLSKKGKTFAVKSYFELRKIRLNKKKVKENTDELETYITEIIEVTEEKPPANSWRYNVGSIVYVNSENKKHPFNENDRLEVLSLENKGGYGYGLKHESSNNETFFIINDNNLK